MANSKRKNNILNYTGLDFDQIRSQVEDEINADPNFENFRESSIAKTILDIFAATTDLTNFYLERRAEEQFLDTARLRSSAISLSKILGYVVRRPIPAGSAVSIVIKGPLPAGLPAGETITFQKFTTSFVGNGIPFILKNSYTYEFTSDDITAGVGNSNFEKQIDFGVVLSATDAPIPLDDIGGVDSRSLVDIEIMQGEFIITIIQGADNTQVGQLFQKYKIDDTTFSNFYGDEDLGFNKVTGEENLSENLTKLGIGLTQTNAFESENLFSINRRSLVDPSKIPDDFSFVPKVVLIDTSMSEGVNVSFGDDKFASKGLPNSNENIFVQYFSTLGTIANAVGVIGQDVTSPTGFFTNGDATPSSTTFDLTNNITFKFSRNITNGSDMESIDSIKLNAPEIYYSLDRLVTSKDYIAFLKTQTIGSIGGQIKNAIAWGEQEEIRRRNQKANFRFFNIVFFSPLGSIYKFPDGGEFNILNQTEIHEAFLELEEDFSTVTSTTSGVVSADGFPEQVYFNVLVKELPQPEVQRVEEFRDLNSDHPITLMYDKLNVRSQTTIRHIYISPIVQTLRLKGRVSIGKLEDRVQIRKKVNNEIYEFLNEVADYGVDIQKSAIYDIIQNTTEVISSNIFFEPVVPDRLITTFNSDPDIINSTTSATSATVVSAFEAAINTYLTSAGFAKIGSTQSDTTSALLDINDTIDLSASSLPGSASSNFDPGVWDGPYQTGSLPDFHFEDTAHLRVGFVSEKTFYTDLMKDVYDRLGSGQVTVDNEEWRESQFFKNMMFKLHNDLEPVIKTGILDIEGNINDYSLNNEIVQIQVALSYQFV